MSLEHVVGSKGRSSSGEDKVGAVSEITYSTTPSFPNGVTLMHECSDPIADICFVHGLTGDRDSTWTADGQSEPWPKELLSPRLSRVRILTYGYDAYAERKSAAGSNRLVDHARNLLNDLTTDRSFYNALFRPLIFVTHSLGGIVCKEAILLSQNSPKPHIRGIFSCTRGIIFMGTPHNGTWMTDWAKIPASALGLVQSTKSLLNILETDSQVLEFIQVSFWLMIRELREAGRCLEVTCFFEELPLPMVGKVVSKASATLKGYNLIGIHANHRDMVKFSSSEDTGFKRLLIELIRWQSYIRYPVASQLARSMGEGYVSLATYTSFSRSSSKVMELNFKEHPLAFSGRSCTSSKTMSPTPDEKWHWDLHEPQRFFQSSLWKVWADALDECDADHTYNRERMERRVETLSCNLAEAVPSSNPQIVQFICQFVQDFFVQKGQSTLDSSLKPTNWVIRIPLCQLSRTCLRYLAAEEIAGLTTRDRRCLMSTLPLLHYPTTSWVAHVKQSEARDMPHHDLLNYFAWPSKALVQPWVRVYGITESRPVDCPKGSTMVHIMSRYRLIEQLSVILQNIDQVGMDINARDEHGRTPLLLAAEIGQERVVEMLLNTGKVDVNARDEHGRTPLIWAAKNGCETVVKLLLSTDEVDVNARDNYGRGPLFSAAENGHETVVKVLLNTGDIDVGAKNEYGGTPLLLAVENGHAPVVMMLLNTEEVDVDAKDKFPHTPLSLAAESGHELVVKMLLDMGKVNVDARDEQGRTPLSDESVFSAQADNGRAPGTELSCHEHHFLGERQRLQVPRLQGGLKTSRTTVHGADLVELEEVEQVTLRTEELHLDGDLEFHSFEDDTIRPGEDIFADDQIPAHNSFMADPAHRYWTWSAKDGNWWHKDKETNTIIWTPLDFD
ncbi:hypothetical protein DL765_004371 [Monosporascus sp. GIB2]|nr:hypothetical protein DL765_004371 [Monosporascus sp. GIB2]